MAWGPCGGVASELEFAKFSHLDGGQVRRHGAIDAVVPLGGAIAVFLGHERAIGDDGEGIIRGDANIVSRFFARGVITREPTRSAIGL